MTRHAKSIEILGLAAWLVVTFAAAAIGGFASASAGNFYQELVRPSWAPPGWLFAPTWTALYVLMGIAVWLVWRARPWRDSLSALVLFLMQLALNALWTWLFFVWRMGAAAFIEIVILWVLIACTIVAFWRVRPIAGYLLIPYLLWVNFAAALTWAVWRSNPNLL